MCQRRRSTRLRRRQPTREGFTREGSTARDHEPEAREKGEHKTEAQEKDLPGKEARAEKGKHEPEQEEHPPKEKETGKKRHRATDDNGTKAGHKQNKVE